MQVEWTGERVDILKKLWLDGLSASQIAGELGAVTRNAVIGKVHRLGLGGRTKVRAPSFRGPRPPKDRMVRIRQRSPSRFRIGDHEMEAEALPVEDVKPDTAISIDRLTDSTCRWPFGDPGKEQVMYCGRVTFEDGGNKYPYCKAHCCKAYTVADRRRSQNPVSYAPKIIR